MNDKSTGARDPLDLEPLRFLVGPTATGKSDLALELAERSGAEIVSLDSMLVYRGMDVGTAKPDAAARARVRHHVLDVVDPPERFTVQRYLAEVRAALVDIHTRGRRALFVGGTGLYLKILLAGLFDGPETDPIVRDRWSARYDELGGLALHAELRAIDSLSAERLHPNDKKRIVRALEVFEQTGRPLSDWQREWRAPDVRRAHFIVGLDSAVHEIDRAIERRTAAMLEHDWVGEVRRIQSSGGFGPTSIQALGYADVLELALGRIDRDECARRVALATRQFARRQRTWFRKFSETRWYTAQTKNPAGWIDGVLRELRLN